MSPRYTDKRLLNDLKLKAKILGRLPTKEEVDEDKNKMSYKMDKKVDTKSLEDLTKEQLINIINNCSDATKTEILKYE